MNLQNLFDDYIKSGLYLKGWSIKTPAIYRRAFASFQKSQREASDFDETLTKARLEAWIIWMRTAESCGAPNKRNMSPAGANIYIRAMNSFSAWLHEEHGHQQIVLKQLKAPLKPVTVFSDVDLRLILSFKPRTFTGLRTWTLICLLLDTGCRISEILDLRTPDCDFDNLLLTVHGKGNKYRKVPFSAEMRKHLFRYAAKRVKRNLQGDFVFCVRNGGRLKHRNFYRDLIVFCRRLGITKRVHPHLTRHTFACHFMKNGGSIYSLSRILGHTSVSTTQTYIRGLGVEDFKEEHARMSPLSRLS